MKIETSTIGAIIVWIAFISLVGYAFYTYWPEDNPGPCVEIATVVDGDTFITTDGVVARLRNIDTPELETFKGQIAADRAKSLLEGKCLTVKTDGSRGKYDRLLVEVKLPDGTWYSDYMIENNLADKY